MNYFLISLGMNLWGIYGPSINDSEYLILCRNEEYPTTRVLEEAGKEGRHKASLPELLGTPLQGCLQQEGWYVKGGCVGCWLRAASGWRWG